MTDHEGNSQIIRSLYGATSHPCDEGGHQFGLGIDSIWPFEAGTEHSDGFFYVIGRDVAVWLAGKSYQTWAIREFTEHGSTWVTRVSPELGVAADGLVGIETASVPAMDAAAIGACIGG